MRATVIGLIVSIAALSSPTAGASLDDLSQPLAAAAWVQPDGTYVAWVPGPVEADSFIIYGLTGTSMLPLSQVPGGEAMTHLTQSQGFSGYGVAAVVDGVASEPTIAALVENGCISVTLVPPDVAIGCGIGELPPDRIDIGIEIRT